MKSKLVLIFLLIFTHSAISQNQLFFVKATTVDDPYILTIPIPAGVYKYEKDSMKLKQVLPLTSDKLWFKDLSYNYDARTMIIKQEIKKTFEEKISVLKTDRLDTLIPFPETCPLSYRYAKYNFIEKNGIPYLLLTCRNRDDKKRDYFRGINLSTFSEKEFTLDMFKDILINGNSHFQYNMTDMISGYTDDSTGNVHLAVIKPLKPNYSDRPILPYEIPDSLQRKRKDLIFIYVNNKNSLVLNKSKGYIFYNKQTKQWFTRDFTGDKTSVYSYGNWLVGTILQSYKKYSGDTLEKKYSPGKELRKKLNSNNPFNVDERFFDYGVYSPGILYLLNTFSQKYIEIVTNQGDSEILLVEDNMVYYRVNDEIFKSIIINDEKLGTPELLIKNIDVLDIHWAFITK
jgi:hypothetical protein